MERFPRLENTLGMTYNECSIAAADSNRRATELISTPEYIERASLLRYDAIGEPVRGEFDIVRLTDEIPLADGRPVQAVVVRETGSGTPKLMALVRGELAFPVAGFVRRPGSECDFIQLAGEISDENIVVTPQDELSRKDVVELVRGTLELNPLNVKYGHLLEIDFDKLVKNFREQQKRIVSDEGYSWDVYSRRGKYKVGQAVLVAARNMGLIEGTLPNKYYSKSRKRRRAHKILDGHKNVSAEDILAGKALKKLKQSELRPLAALVVAFGKEEEGGFINDEFEHSQFVARELFDAVGLHRTIEAHLGTYDTRLEKVIATIGSLSARQATLAGVIKNMAITSTRADTEVELKAFPTTTSGIARLNISAMPMAMVGHEPAENEYHVSMIGRNDHFTPDDLAEMAGIIDAVSAVQATRVI